ncbi:MAG: ASPIC/UnbV domain-containing protein, partial [Planctomycetota bacterium]
AAAFGDIDNDGGLDILVVNRDERAYLLLNTAPRRGHWICFRVLDAHGRDAYGATLRFRTNGRQLTRDVRAAYSYQASNDPRVHVGLGATSRVEGVVVQWVDGSREAFGDFGADQVVTLERGGGPHQ